MGSKTKIKCENQQRIHTGTSADKNSGTKNTVGQKKNTVGHVTVPMKTDLNADIFESVFIVESDRASCKLQNDTKIELLSFRRYVRGNATKGRPLE